jgi:hypothetical protein
LVRRQIDQAELRVKSLQAATLPQLKLDGERGPRILLYQDLKIDREGLSGELPLYHDWKVICLLPKPSETQRWRENFGHKVTDS